MKILSLILILIATTAQIYSQAPARHPGVVLYEQAKYSDSLRSLEIASKTKEYKSDAEIWNYLGLAYVATNKLKNGRKAFEKSVKLNPAETTYRTNLGYTYLLIGQAKKAGDAVDRAIQLDPKNARAYEIRGTLYLWQRKLHLAERDADAFIQLSPANPGAYFLKTDILLTEFGEKVKAGSTMRREIGFLKRAVDVLEAGVRSNPTSPKLPELRSELESITYFRDYYDRTPEPVATPAGDPVPEPNVTPVKILYQPKAKYTDRARVAGIEGAVRLVILLGDDGEVKYVLKLWGLGYGLDEEAIRAAKAIRFEPKMRDGRPVPLIITREYTFEIY